MSALAASKKEEASSGDRISKREHYRDTQRAWVIKFYEKEIRGMGAFYENYGGACGRWEEELVSGFPPDEEEASSKGGDLTPAQLEAYGDARGSVVAAAYLANLSVTLRKALWLPWAQAERVERDSRVALDGFVSRVAELNRLRTPAGVTDPLLRFRSDHLPPWLVSEREDEVYGAVEESSGKKEEEQPGSRSNEEPVAKKGEEAAAAAANAAALAAASKKEEASSGVRALQYGGSRVKDLRGSVRKLYEKEIPQMPKVYKNYGRACGQWEKKLLSALPDEKANGDLTTAQQVRYSRARKHILVAAYLANLSVTMKGVVWLTSEQAERVERDSRAVLNGFASHVAELDRLRTPADVTDPLLRFRAEHVPPAVSERREADAC